MKHRFALGIHSLRLTGWFVFAACSSAPTTVDGGVDASVDVAQEDVVVQDASDASIADASDAEASAPTCDPTKPFNTPVPLVGFATTAAMDGPSLSPDELTMYFSSNLDDDAGTETFLYVTSRATTSDVFSAPTALALNQPSTIHLHPTLSPNALMLFYGRSVIPTRLWVATRATTADEFSNVGEFSDVASSYALDDEGDPFVTADGEELWFYSTRSGGVGGTDLWAAKKSGTSFANASDVTSLNSAYGEFAPTLSADRLTIYFASSNGGTNSSSHIWWSHRASTSVAFPAPTVASELNSSPTSTDMPGWLSPDNCRLYLYTTRASSTYQIYLATRSP